MDEEFRTDNQDIKLEEFTGGYYAIMKAKYSYNGWAWGEFLKWLSKSTEFDLGNYWFFEEYKLNKPELDMDTQVVLHMPVKQKV